MEFLRLESPMLMSHPMGDDHRDGMGSDVYLSLIRMLRDA